MASIDITKDDLIKAVPQVVGKQEGTGLMDNLDNITAMADKVFNLIEKGQKFQQLFNRPPASKEEMRLGRPANMDSLGNASQVNIQNQFQDQLNQKEIRIKDLEALMNEKLKITIDEKKVDEKIEELILMIDKIPPEVLEQKLKDVLELKNMFKAQIRKYILVAIPEMIKYDKQ